MTDNAGTWPSWNDIKSGFNTALDWANSNLLQPILGFIYDVAEDYNNYDLNNQSETVVFSSNYFSGYRGAFVMKTPFDASFSFGFIGLSIHQQDSSTIKHEYGHTVQFKEKGLLEYTGTVAIPSVTINILDRQQKLPYDYYSYPWEAQANMYGGTNLSQSWKPALPEGGYTSYWDIFILFFQ